MASTRMRPSESLVICSVRALRAASDAVTVPMNSGGMSIVIRSYGSWTWPSTSRSSTSGRDTWSS